jgi:thymidine phosphorylase
MFHFVSTGKAAFLKEYEKAEQLANYMVCSVLFTQLVYVMLLAACYDLQFLLIFLSFSHKTQISRMLNIKACAFITIHDNPIGRTIGNQIEIEETIECLHGNIPDDIAELVSNFGMNKTYSNDFHRILHCVCLYVILRDIL